MSDSDRVHERAVRYFDSAAERELADLRNAPPGGRNDALNRAVHGLSSLHATLGGRGVRLDSVDQLCRRTLEAAQANGSIVRQEGGVRAFNATWRSAWAAGQKSLRKLPSELDADLDRVRFPPIAPTMGAAVVDLDQADELLEAPLERPPVADLRVLWDRCGPIDTDAEASSWLLEQRGFSRDALHRLVDADLARVLPKGFDVERWAGGFTKQGQWHSWPSVGLRVIVPLYDHLGELRGMRWRRPWENQAADWPPKARGPSPRGLVMACGLARQLLRAGCAPDWWPRGTELCVFVLEGEVDFLYAASGWSDSDECAPASLGIVAGSWSAAIADRIPDGSTLVIATDNDAGGEKYRERINQTVLARRRAGKLRVQRWRPKATT
jgi:hypothetical protein